MPGRHRDEPQTAKVKAAKEFFNVRKPKPEPKKVFPKGKKLTPSDTDSQMQRG